jgi:AraC-like DNA-binding protein
MVSYSLSTPSQRSTAWLADDIARDIHRFNVFQVDHTGEHFDCRQYNRPGYYKISLHQGANRLFNTEQAHEFQDAALVFSLPDEVYSWEQLGEQQTSYFCVFTEDFFERFAGIGTYEVFNDGSSPVLRLTTEQHREFSRLFQQMTREIALDFRHKYDLLRALVAQVILMAVKLRPAAEPRPQPSNAAVRVTERFMELLEQQFPVASPAYRMALRHPIDYAQRMALHVNYLNRALKETTGKTTSHLIADRAIQEAQELLTHTTWNVVEIAWCLGYEDVSHFTKAFKKCGGVTPTYFRKALVA